MKKMILRMAAWALAAICLYGGPVQALGVSAQSAIVMDGDQGQVLWEKNADKQSLIASTTKIMTALVVLEHAALEDPVTVASEAVGIEGSSMYLKAGEALTVQDLLYGLMLSSGNDAAVALSIHVAGSPEAFAELMNAKAQELGLKNTHFANPNGLDSEENYATARSLGQLAVAAMKNDSFRTIVSTKKYNCTDHFMTNHNKLLWQYEGAVGVKTGFTKHAGRILVGSAERNGRRLVSVTINAPSDWSDHKQMLDYGFSCYSPRLLVTQGQQVGFVEVVSGTQDQIPLVATEDVSFSMLPDEEAELRVETETFVYAPVSQGQALGTLQVFVGDRLISEQTVLAGAAVERLPEEPGFWDKVKEKLPF